MYLCIDIGGTKTLIGLFSKNGHKLFKKRFLTDKNPKKFIKDLEKALKFFPKNRCVALSVAVPGTVEHGLPKKYGNLPWNDFNLKKAISALFPKDFPISFINDADAAALYEGSFYPYDTTLYVTFSTGIGAGLTIDGKLSKESATLEPGHDFYVLKGKSREWEDIASAAAIREIYGQPVTTLKDKAIWDDVSVRLALGLSDLIKTYRPTVLVFDGPLARMLPRFSRPLRRLLVESLPTNCPLPSFFRAHRPSESVIYGLYLLGKNTHDSH